MILYIHGFGSTGNSFKSEMLKKHFPDETVLCPNLKHEPVRDMMELYSIVDEYKKKENVLLVGTSLGGYYAYLLSRMLEVPCALVNPSMKPNETLVKHVGKCENYNTEETFEWTTEHLSELKEMGSSAEKSKYYPHMIHVFIGEEDEKLSHENIREILPFASVTTYPGENHRFTHFGLLMEEFSKILY
jgi:predicted esterase YcpF (UPF0227 family)